MGILVGRSGIVFFAVSVMYSIYYLKYAFTPVSIRFDSIRFNRKKTRYGSPVEDTFVEVCE